MDDLDLEQLKQELHDVSGGSIYDVDEIMREAGSDASKGSGTSLEELMKSLGVEMEEPKTQPMPQEEQKTELLKTQPVTQPESDRTQPVGMAAPVTENMMPEWQGKEDLSALFLAAEQTQALVDEQDAMAEEGKPEQEIDPLEEQDNVFAQLFARLGEIEQEETPTDPRLTEPFEEPEEEPDLMARLFQPAEDLMESQEQPVEKPSAEPEEPVATRSFESVLDRATRVMEQAEESVPEPEAAMEASEPDGTELLTQNIDPVDTYDETETYDEEKDLASADEEDAEVEDTEEKPRRGFFARLFGSAEDEEEDELDDEEDEPDEASEEEYDEEDDASETEEDAADEYDEEESEPEDEEDAEDFDEEEDFEDSEETDEEEIEEKPKRGFFARLFGSEEEEEDELDDEEEELDEASEEEYDEEDDASETEEDAADEYDEEESEPEDEEDTEDFDEEEDFEDSEETDEEEIEEKPKRGFFARLFGPEEEEEDELDDEEDELNEASEEEYDEEDDASETEEDAEDEFDEEDSEEAEESVEEMPENMENDETEEPAETDLDDLDATQAFDALSEQETQRIVLPPAGIAVAEEQPVETEMAETEVLTELSEEPEETDTFEEPGEESQDSEAAEEEASEEETQPKQGFLNRLMDVFGLEIVEEEVEPEETEEAESETEEEHTEPEEMPAEKTEVADDQWYDLEEPAEELPEQEPEKSVESVQTEAGMETEPEEEMDRMEAEFRDILQREEDIGAEEETLSVPQPRPEDTPVISEEELAAFLADVEEEEEEVEKVSFEQLLRDNGIDVEAEKEEQKLSLEEFPEEETTVYVDVPIRVASAEEQEDRQPELFDAEAEMEKEPEYSADLREPEVEPETAEEPVDEPELESEKEPEEQPEPDPDWLNLPMEQLYQIAPSMAVLRQEGPVMAREVLRQKEWIMARIRRYKDEQNGTLQPQEEPEEEPEQPEPTEPSEDVDAIHAADELHALLEQDAEDDAVFPDGPTDKPETEAAGQKEIILEVTATVRETEPKDDMEPDMEPESDMEPEEEPEQPVKPEQAVWGQQKKHKPKAAAKPNVQIPKNLNQESKACRRRAGKQARRASVIAVLTLICIYISCAADFTLLPLPDAMNYVYHPANVLIVFLVLMGLSILLAYDVVWDGIQALMQLQPNLSTLIDLALVLNIVHCITRLVSEGEEIPYACIVMLVLFAQLRAQVSRSTILHYTYKVAGNAREPMGLFYHDGSQPHLVKAPLENTDAFIAQTLQRGIRHRMESIFTILSVVTAVVLAVIVCVATGDLGRLVYVLAATVTGACQIALICAMVMARSHSARRMQRNGAAADDNLGVQYLGKAETVVLTDEDLFPASSIALERLELRSNLNDATALAYAAALTGETSLGHMLAEEVRTRYGAPLVARHVVEDVNGGVSGQVGGIQVLLGDERYMAEHGIIAREVPENGLILALDGDVAAILVIDYQVPAALFNAMQVLTERKIHIWLHTRNHQITPELVQQKYALKPGMVSIPKLETDRALRNPQYTAHDRLCGLLGRDGFIPLSGCITSAREEARVAPLGVVIGACAALLCMLLMTYLCYVFVPEDAHPIRVLIYMILCFIPIFFLENGIGKE